LGVNAGGEMMFHRIGFQQLRKTKHPKLLKFLGVTLGVTSCKLLIISDFGGERGYLGYFLRRVDIFFILVPER
jgi:hypothetical protein